MGNEKRNIIWAPWRIGYVGGVRKKGCFLCAALRSDGGENLVFYRGRHAFAILNLYPYNNGHLMVVPNRHVKSLDSLSPDEESECLLIVKAAMGFLRRKFKAEGFNVGLNFGKAAGAGLEDHMHFHVVPRWNGDTNFMPVFSGTKVISQSLDELKKVLMEKFGAEVEKMKGRHGRISRHKSN